MNAALRVFVSSVQLELEDERVSVQHLITTDSFLSKHCAPVLYEFEPASPENAVEGCLRVLDECHVYLLIVGKQYGALVGDRSITHEEYRRAVERQLPVLAFIKGSGDGDREAGTRALLAEVKARAKYKRFGNVVELQREVRAALADLLEQRFGIAPSSDEDQIAQQTIEATSPFESQPLKRLAWGELDHSVALRLVATAEGQPADEIGPGELLGGATLRGLAWLDPDSGEHYATAAGVVLLAKDPSAVFPQCRILADAYRGVEPDSAPSDHEDICAAAPVAIERAIAFVDRNTRHPMRVVGLDRVRLDEYPVAALREALVNATAHRRYEDAGRKILLEVLADRVVVSSPGLPPAPLTLASLRTGKYKPCSRNPLIAQSLSYFHRIEERGSGFRRMRDQMLDHGLDPPTLATQTGYFQVTFTGPGEQIDRLRVPTDRLKVTPSVEASLNDRQRRILAHALEAGKVTTAWCMETLGVARDTAYRDLQGLVRLELLKPEGRGRSARYVPADAASG